MRINPDCIRVVMLTIENNLELGEIMQLFQLMDYPLVQSFTEQDVEYSLHQLTKEKMIECEISYCIDGSYDYTIEDITPLGHQFCDKLRDKSLWDSLKSTFNDVGTISEITTILANAVSLADSLIN